MELGPDSRPRSPDGNFDQLLSHCTSLTDLTVQFAYTGPALLDSLRSTSHLTSLILLGTPTQIRAEDLAMRLEGPVQGVDQFERLERLIVSGSWFQGAGGWSGASVREIKRVCKERRKKVFCSFASA